tara:strand:- start:227 stop:1123 length:897 start_codon:yes stop_codon:yes gene_type:complete
MKINFINRDCPVCSENINNSAEIIPDINPTNNDDIIKAYWTGFFKSHVFFPYFRCLCGFLYNKNFPDENSLQTLYSKQDDNIISGDIKLDLKTKINYLIQLKNLFSSNARNLKILEIGADNGSFLKLIRNDYIHYELYALEPNANMQKSLNEVAKKIFRNINDIDSAIKFDLIIGIHVFDHLPNINSYIQKLNSHLHTDGYIFGVVHNEKSFLAKILKKRWPAYRLQHPHLFNHFSLNNLLYKSKFEKIFIKRTKNFFSVGFLINQLALAIFKVKINLPNFFSIGLKLGNFSFLYKKK